MVRSSKGRGKGRPRSRDREPPLHFIAEWRDVRGYTQAKLAELMDAANGSISEYESGGMFLSTESARAIAGALGITVQDLFLNPKDPDYQLWREIRAMEPSQKAQALRVIRAMVAEETT